VSGTVLLIIEVCLPVVLFFFLLLTYSLRGFSRSTLSELCEQRHNKDRFTSIMRCYRQAILLCDGLGLGLLVCSVALFCNSTWLTVLEFPSPAEPLTTSLWVLRCLVAFGLMWVGLISLPWSISRVRGERILYRTWPLLRFMVAVLRPFWRLAFAFDQALHRVVGLPDPHDPETPSNLEDELRALISECHREGVLRMQSSHMIMRVVDLQDEDVASIMKPRTEMVTIPAATPLNEALERVIEDNYSRVPVTGDSVDDIQGVLYARDLLAEITHQDSTAQQKTVGDVAREVVFVPESQRIGSLLENMQQKQVHLAIVVDEYSGVAGLVTLEDVLEEIVGEITDEHDEEEVPLLTVVEDGSIEVDGRFHINDLNRDHGFQFPEDEEYDTIGGFMMAELARIPAVGESIQWKDTILEVTEADERQLKKLHLVRNSQ
jgi:CBS domain containing-hemolysin-like protein